MNWSKSLSDTCRTIGTFIVCGELKSCVVRLHGQKKTEFDICADQPAGIFSVRLRNEWDLKISLARIDMLTVHNGLYVRPKSCGLFIYISHTNL